jgi:dolichol-phosphate mannosyltransferase
VQQQTGADIVTGSRYVEGGGVHGWPVYRKLVSRVANFITNEVFRTDFSDLTGSFRLYRASVLRRLLQEVKATGYAFQMEILVRAASAGLRIEQVPIVFVDRIYGHSKLGPGEMVKYIKSIWHLLWDID